jgi:uncharacterized protein YqjF (DUF2071 family)
MAAMRLDIRGLLYDLGMPEAIEAISAATPHRVERPLMRQSWTDLTFLHWRYDAAGVRPLVPPELELDLYDGAAWVGLVPFTITGLTLPRRAAVPWLSQFPETNVRTYVVDREGRRGVWFFSLDAARLAAVAGARTAYALPYFWARMRVESDGRRARYRSVRLHAPRAMSNIEVLVGEPIDAPNELEVFLTARWRLFARRGGRILQAQVEHPPWPLQRAEVVGLKETLLRAAGLPEPHGAPLVHFSARVDVLVGALRGPEPRATVSTTGP